MTKNFNNIKTKTSASAIILAASFMMSSTTPALATEALTETLEAPYDNPIVLETQTLTVSSNVEINTLDRDSYGATTNEEIQTIEAEAAEAARLADLQAAGVARAEEASIRATNSRGGNTSATPKSNVNISGVTPGQVVPADGIISAAQQWVGVVPYGYGNHPSDSFMCDGYVQYVFKQNGINLPRGADSQARQGTVIPWSEGKAGDLVWWPGQHIAIYDGEGGYYHSPTWGKYVTHAKKVTWGNPVIVRL